MVRFACRGTPLVIRCRVSVVVLAGVQEVVWGDVCLSEDRPEGSLGKLTRMVHEGCITIGTRVVPDLVAPGSLAVELKTKASETFGDLPVAEP